MKVNVMTSLLTYLKSKFPVKSMTYAPVRILTGIMKSNTKNYISKKFMS